jgi:(4S)-4-hydroxy-5-phosphonooxypentane-2,3-dione isomerase
VTGAARALDDAGGGATAAPDTGTVTPTMYIVIVDLHVKPERLDEFLPAMIENASASRRDEPGCVRFDVVQDENDPAHLVLYEIYRDRAAFEEDHLKRPHFLRWRETVRDWYTLPPASWKGPNVFPAGDAIAAGT